MDIMPPEEDSVEDWHTLLPVLTRPIRFNRRKDSRDLPYSIRAVVSLPRDISHSPVDTSHSSLADSRINRRMRRPDITIRDRATTRAIPDRPWCITTNSR